MTIDETIMRFEQTSEHNQKLYDMYYDYIGKHQWKKDAEEYGQLAEWLKELKSLKEKDEPRTVRYEGDGYADGAMVYDTAFCPNCNHEFEEDSENWECEFCPNCGQRLRWEE